MLLTQQAELAALAGALATRHEARDKAIVELSRLDEVQAKALGRQGFQRHQVCQVLYAVGVFLGQDLSLTQTLHGQHACLNMLACARGSSAHVRGCRFPSMSPAWLPPGVWHGGSAGGYRHPHACRLRSWHGLALGCLLAA